ncbi:MAG: hypothetical protein M3R45_01980 [Pseudomonadota bacterium]|nr:hypothetical protein [Pseudomonadota bacterium]
MNCQLNDLAIVVRSALGPSTGLVLRCIRLSSASGLRNLDGSFEYGPVWETDAYGPALCGNTHNLWLDADLRALRDEPGEDETLQWAGLPQGKPVEVC